MRATHGTDADRRWHAVHGNGVPYHTCWPASDGLPPMPESTAANPPPPAGWLEALIRAEFGADISDELAA